MAKPKPMEALESLQIATLNDRSLKHVKKSVDLL